MDEKKKETLIRAGIIAVLVILIVIVGAIMTKYEIEGETNLPFQLTNIMVISTADGISDGTNQLEVVQSNDLYLTIEKNENYDGQEMIKQISIENISILSKPVKGYVAFYRPNNKGEIIYQYQEEFLLDNSVIYQGGSATDLRTLTISNQGGIIGFRTCVKGITTYQTEEGSTTGINNDSTLLQKAAVELNDIKYNIGFDVIIELVSGKKYKGYVNTTLPKGDIEQKRVSGVEKVDIENVIFKRVKF